MERKGKTFSTLSVLTQSPTAQAASIHAAVTDGNIYGRCLAFLMSKQATDGCALQHAGQPEACMDNRQTDLTFALSAAAWDDGILLQQN